MTGNESKVQEGRDKKLGDPTPSISVDTHSPIPNSTKENDYEQDSRSGTTTGGCFHRLAPTDNDSDSEDEAAALRVGVAVDDTATRYQHGDYTGPNLTAPPPLHYSAGTSIDRQGRLKPRSIEEEDEGFYDQPDTLEGGEGGEGGERAGYDLHGGFPTGAPSPLPSGRGRGAGVLDPFDI